MYSFRQKIQETTNNDEMPRNMVSRPSEDKKKIRKS